MDITHGGAFVPDPTPTGGPGVTKVSLADGTGISWSITRKAGIVTATPSVVTSALPGSEIDYVQRTTNYSNATTGFTSVIDGNPVSFDGATRVKIEFAAALCELSGASVSAFVELFDGATDLCEVAGMTANSGTGVVDLPLIATPIFLTPSAGTHTYHIKSRMLTAGSVLIAGGTGSGGGFAPCWYRITRA